MSDSPKEKTKKKSNVEKPVSLFGAKFEDVLGALLKTKPKKQRSMPEKDGGDGSSI